VNSKWPRGIFPPKARCALSVYITYISYTLRLLYLKEERKEPFL
jgi:hypothetical protein